MKAKKEKNIELQDKVAEMRKIINALNESVCALRATGLNEKVILYAIQQASPNVYRNGQIPMSLIKATLEGVENLQEFMFPKE